MYMSKLRRRRGLTRRPRLAEPRCCLETTLETRLAEVDEVLGCLVVQTVEHHEAELECDLLRYIEPM